MKASRFFYALYVTIDTLQPMAEPYLYTVKKIIMNTTVIIGGSFAGMTAALEIKRKDKGIDENGLKSS